MKKIVLIISILTITYSIQAQNSTSYKSGIGISIGVPVGINYKVFTADKSALDFTGGLRLNADATEIWLNGMYEQHVNLKMEGLKFYYGVGATGILSSASNSGLGISGVLGLDLRLGGAPIALALDWTPTYYLIGFKDYNQGIALKARYILD